MILIEGFNLRASSGLVVEALSSSPSPSRARGLSSLFADNIAPERRHRATYVRLVEFELLGQPP